MFVAESEGEEGGGGPRHSLGQTADDDAVKGSTCGTDCRRSPNNACIAPSVFMTPRVPGHRSRCVLPGLPARHRAA